jgi:hypothetical protein
MISTLAKPARGSAAGVLILCLILSSPKLVGAADPKREPRPAPAAEAPAPPPLRMDPATGLPIPPPPAQWVDPNWQEPEKIIHEISFDGLPLAEIARYLREQFKDSFDIIVPGSWQEDPAQPSSVPVYPGDFTIKLQLKNVRASEIFNAMNLVLEGENNPVRWELKMNGARPIALLRYLPDLLPQHVKPPAPEPPKRMIYFVGDLLGDEKSGGMSIEQLVKTISEVYDMSYGKAQHGKQLQFHKEAQLLIVNGTAEHITFVQDTLRALRQKAQMDRQANTFPKGPEPKAKPEN